MLEPVVVTVTAQEMVIFGYELQAETTEADRSVTTFLLPDEY